MPNASKRKRNQIDDDDDDEEPSLGRQILPVANLPEDFDGEPMDGMQYLFTVRRDARYLPHTTRVANPYDIEVASSAPPVGEFLTENKANAILPSEDWRMSFTKRFTNFRKNLLQPTIHIHIPQTPQHKIMPDKKERDAWWNFIAGNPESDWNIPKKPKVDRRRRYGQTAPAESDSGEEGEVRNEVWQVSGDGETQPSNDPSETLPTPSGTPAPPDVIKSETVDGSLNHAQREIDSKTIPGKQQQREPTPSLIAHLDHRTSLHLLMYFAHWINVHVNDLNNIQTRITEVHARWIFVLLSRVEDHISADDMHLLRNLARALLSLLKELKKSRITQESVPDQADNTGIGQFIIGETSCWILISAVAEFWCQKDLWMDAESMLVTTS